MNSMIFRMSSYVVLPFALVLSLYLLWRGHNEPGGGFVAGLIAAAGVASYALPRGHAALKRILPIDSLQLLAIGVAAALLSGIPGILAGNAFLTHQWTDLAGLAIGTALLFDIGVYLAVLGSITTFIGFFLER